MSENQATIKVKALTKHFGEFPAVSGIDFEVFPGEIFGFLGPNGSGKTTTIRMMLGLLQPNQGEVEVLGIPVHKSPELIRPRVGYMSQRFSLYNDLSVIQNLRFYGRAYGITNAELDSSIQSALTMSGLTGKENTKTKDLAGGWRQRLALSVAFMHRPEVIFLDEPTAGVDPVSRREFWDLLYDLVSDGVTVFVTTHYMDEAEHCHRLAFIQDGRIIAYGAPDEIREQTIKGQVIEISTSNTSTALAVLEEARQSRKMPISEVELYGSLLHVFSNSDRNIEKDIRSLLKRNKIEVSHIARIEPTLEDVFIARMKMGKQQAVTE